MGGDCAVRVESWGERRHRERDRKGCGKRRSDPGHRWLGPGRVDCLQLSATGAAVRVSGVGKASCVLCWATPAVTIVSRRCADDLIVRALCRVSTLATTDTHDL